MKTRAGILCTGTATVLLVGLSATPAEAAPTLAQRAVKVAAAQKGDRYQYGATGPHRFDCSGLTLYSFKKAGKTLPRTAQQQYNKTKRVGASKRKVGDLVFFGGTRSIYHVGIYAGNNKIWHAPKPGTRVRLEKLWTKNVRYGRV